MDEITNRMPLIGEGDETLKSLKDFVDKMEDEYIDKKKLLEEAIKLSGPQTGDGWDNWGVYSLIRRQPVVDVVPVVRCHDCKFFMSSKTPPFIICMNPYGKTLIGTSEDEFCDRGEAGNYWEEKRRKRNDFVFAEDADRKSI